MPQDLNSDASVVQVGAAWGDATDGCLSEAVDELIGPWEKSITESGHNVSQAESVCH